MALVDLLPGLGGFAEREVCAYLDAPGLRGDWWRTLPVDASTRMLAQPRPWERIAELVVAHGPTQPFGVIAPILLYADSSPRLSRWPRRVVVALRSEGLDWQGLIRMSAGDLLARPALEREDVVGIVAGTLREGYDLGVAAARSLTYPGVSIPRPLRSPASGYPIAGAPVVGVDPPGGLVEVLNAFLATWSERERHVAGERLFVYPPPTLESVAAGLGVTRERVRQIQRRCVVRLERWAIGPGGPLLAAHVVELATRLGSVARLTDLIDAHPRHREPIPVLGGRVPLWAVVAALLPHRIGDGWLTVETPAAAEAETRHRLRALCARGAVPWSAVEEAVREGGVFPGAITQWLERVPQVRRFGDRGVWWGPTVNDKAEAVLTLEGTSLTLERIVRLVGDDYAVSSVGNQLQSDERFMRTDRHLYGLRSWDVEEYLGIREMIEIEVRRNGGELRVDDAVASLTGRFDVSESSVRAYAAGPTFERHRPGWVRIAPTGPGIAPIPYTPRRAVSHTQRCFHHDGRWWYRVDVREMHLRGCGFPIPNAFAAHAGMAPGGRVVLAHDEGEVRVTWRSQPCVGSLRSLMFVLRVRVGDHMFVSMDEGRLSARLVRAAPLELARVRRALRLVGSHDQVPAGEATAHVARALGLPETTPLAAIVARLIQRRDRDIAELLAPK